MMLQYLPPNAQMPPSDKWEAEAISNALREILTDQKRVTEMA